MGQSSRSWIAIFIGIVLIFCVLLIMPRYDAGPKGIVLPLLTPSRSTDTDRDTPRSLDAVSIYDQVTAPFDVKILGSISVIYHTLYDTDEERLAVERVARGLVAQIGGDGLVLQQFGHTYPNVPAAMAVMVLRGLVILHQ